MENVSLGEDPAPLVTMPASAIQPAPAPIEPVRVASPPPAIAAAEPAPAPAGLPAVAAPGAGAEGKAQGGGAEAPAADGSGVLFDEFDDPINSVPAPTFSAGLMRFGKTLRKEAEQAAAIAGERASAAAAQAAVLSEEYRIKEKMEQLRKDATEAAEVATSRVGEVASVAAEEARKAAAATELMLGLEHVLPGTLEAHGHVALGEGPADAAAGGEQWEEHLRDFNRTWGSGAILLVGPHQVGALPPAPDAAPGEVSPDTGTSAGAVRIETVLSSFDAEACGDSKLSKLEQTIKQTLAGAQITPTNDEMISDLTRTVVYYLTVTPGMNLVLEHAVDPPSLMQPRFVVVRNIFEFCIKNEKLCIKNEESCIKNEFCS